MIQPQNKAEAIFLGITRQLLTEDSLRAFARICPIHGEPYQVAHGRAQRCAKCLEAVRDETWPDPTPWLDRRTR